jgi:hypothetical protein
LSLFEWISTPMSPLCLRPELSLLSFFMKWRYEY